MDVLVAQAQTQNALARELAQAVLHPRRIAIIDKAARKSLDDPSAPLDLEQKQRASIRTDRATIESHDDFAPPGACKTKRALRTLCDRGRSLSSGTNGWQQLDLRFERRPVRSSVVREAG